MKKSIHVVISFAVVFGLLVLCFLADKISFLRSNVDNQKDLCPRFLQFISLSVQLFVKLVYLAIAPALSMLRNVGEFCSSIRASVVCSRPSDSAD